MTYEELNQLVAGFGLPYAYYEFPDGTKQAPPFVCFFVSDSNDMLADNTNYVKIRPVVIELYTDNKDFSLEGIIEAGLNRAGLVFSRSETYIDSERMFQITYQTEVVING